MQTPDTRNDLQKSRSHPGLRVIMLAGLLFIIIGYSAYWFWYASQIKNTISQKRTELAAEDIIIEGAPQVTGYPLLHKVTFSGKLRTPLVNYTVPRMQVSGISLPGSTLNILFPKGLKWTPKSPESETYTIDALKIQASLPESLPESAARSDLLAWQKQGGALDIHLIQMVKSPLEMIAQGQLFLDADLQPAGEIRILSKGHEKMISDLEKDKILDRNETAIIRTIVNGLTESSEDEGESRLRLDIRLSSNRLYVGPVPVLKIPHISWEPSLSPYAR